MKKNVHLINWDTDEKKLKVQIKFKSTRSFISLNSRSHGFDTHMQHAAWIGIYFARRVWVCVIFISNDKECDRIFRHQH